MEQKNARQHVQDVCNQLQSAKGCLDKALTSVEKEENRQNIQNTMNAVNNALQTANTTLSTYKE
jgi:DNA-binding FrmR family transcriptional regulator